MKKKIAGIAVLILVTALLVFIYLNTRDNVSSGDILVKNNGNSITVTFNDLELTHVSGQIRNKKGETKQIESEGIALSDIPPIANAGDYSEITVYSDDEYNALLTKDEVSSPGRAWLITDDNKIRLIVFDDEDSKRDVKNVVRIEIK